MVFGSVIRVCSYQWLSDASITNYFGDTYHTTKTDVSQTAVCLCCHADDFEQQDAMSFTFNGTAVYVYGAFRENHGLYQGEAVVTPV